MHIVIIFSPRFTPTQRKPIRTHSESLLTDDSGRMKIAHIPAATHHSVWCNDPLRSTPSYHFPPLDIIYRGESICPLIRRLMVWSHASSCIAYYQCVLEQDTSSAFVCMSVFVSAIAEKHMGSCIQFLLGDQNSDLEKTFFSDLRSSSCEVG